MNLPDFAPAATIVVPAKSLGTTSILANENLRYHPEACSIHPRPVVMFHWAESRAPSYLAGTHDGARDGYFAGGKPVFYRGYCSLEAWLAAGNPHP